MANKVTMPAMPSPMDLAREAAELEKKENIKQAVEAKREPVRKPSNEKNLTYDFSILDASKHTRVTRTFTLDVETEAKLNEMATKFHMNKSALLEFAFNAFYDASMKK